MDKKEFMNQKVEDSKKVSPTLKEEWEDVTKECNFRPVGDSGDTYYLVVSHNGERIGSGINVNAVIYIDATNKNYKIVDFNGKEHSHMMESGNFKIMKKIS